MTTTIMIMEKRAATLSVKFFSMKDVCFGKYTPAVLKKELWQALFSDEQLIVDRIFTK